MNQFKDNTAKLISSSYKLDPPPPQEKPKIGHFDICKAMAQDGLDIQMAPLDNITDLRKVKAGTNVTIGVAGDLVAAIGLEGRFVGGLLLCNREQYMATKLRLEQGLAEPPQAEKEP